MKKLRIFFVISVILVTVILGLRLYARQAALDYIRNWAQSFALLSPAGFGDTAEVRHYIFENEKMIAYTHRVDRLGWFGAGYGSRMREFEQAVLYLSVQQHLPQDQRFISPRPRLRYFTITITPGDHSDKALADAALALFNSYVSQL